MLYPEANAARLCMSLDGVWGFRLAGGFPFDPAAPLPAPEPMAVPGSYNDQKADRAHREHYGLAYYQRTVTLPAFCTGQRVFLRFGAVTHSARVWLDGRLVASHTGGFLPFEAELTGLLCPGGTALLTVEVDNRLSHATLPVGNAPGQGAFFGSDNPGIPSVELGKRMAAPKNYPNFDFFNYAGIHRPVWLYTTPAARITDVTLVPALGGRVRYRVETEGEGPVTLTVLDAAGCPVAEAAGAAGEVTIPSPTLWEPGRPYLYTARITFGGDRYHQPFGVRTVRVEGTKFLINEKPFYFKGLAKHEDFAVHGRGYDPCVNVKDLSLYGWLSANSLRTSHYPYAEEFYALCDRLGIVVIDETTAVGIGAGVAENPYQTFPLRAHHEEVLRALIARDKNHPCVVMWSLGNEPDLEHFPEDARDYWQSLFRQAHAEDPQGRPVTLVCCQNDYTKDLTTRTMDVVCLNRYYGWYNLSGDLDAACLAFDKELDFWAGQNKPVMLTEYGADTLPGLHSTVPEAFTEEFQAEYYARIDALLDARPFVVGEQTWNFADFAAVPGPMRPGGNRKGAFTRERTPKLAAHFLRRRWQGIPDFGYKP